MPSYTITPTGTAVLNTAVITSDGLQQTFLEYIAIEWALDAGVSLSQNGDVVTCSVNPNGASNAATQILLDGHAVDYTTKTLSVVEQILVDFLDSVYSDFKQAKDDMLSVVTPMIAASAWTNGTFSQIDKEIIYKWQCVTNPAYIVALYPSITDRMNIIDHYNSLIVQSREARYNEVRSRILGGLEAADAQEAIFQLCGVATYTNNLGDTGVFATEHAYQSEGSESVLLTGSYGIYDYLDTTFRGAGYVPINGQTLTDFTDDLLDILQNGNY